MNTPQLNIKHLSLAVLTTLSPLAAKAQSQQAPVELEAITVVGRSSSSSYLSEEATAAKTSLPVREVPQSIRVFTKQAIDDLGATRLDDVFDFVGGISRQNSFGGLWDNVAVRGLPGNENTGIATLLNGMTASRGFNAPRDLASVERIEFLKGPAAALYGSSEPGGTLNIVSKRPLWQAANSIETYAGSHGYWRTALDSTGPLSENLAYRLNLAAESRDGFRDYTDSDRQVVAPAFTWKMGADTQLEFVGEYLRHAAPLDRGVVAVNGQLGQIPRERFLGEPSDGKVTLRNANSQAILTHIWNDAWLSRFVLSERETSLEGYSTEASALQSDGSLRRQRRYRDYDSQDLGFQAELQGNLELASTPHEILFGYETYRYTMDTVMLRANPSSASPYAINIYDPIYGQAQPTPGANTDTYETQRNNAFYLQDSISLAQAWRLMAGLRVDNYSQSLQNRRTSSTTEQSPSATSPRLGLSWLPSKQWTLFANSGQSFRPNAGSDRNSEAFEPEKGRSFELGSKWESTDKKLAANAALFQIRKQNVLTADTQNSSYSVAAGEVRSRGAELEFSGQITPRWRVNSAVSYTQVEVLRDNTLAIGESLLNVPAVVASAMAMYENAFSNGQRYGAGGGATYVGERLGQARTQAEANAGSPAFNLPAYTTVRLNAYWRPTKSLRLTLDIDNLFDTTYYTSSYSTLWVSPGSGRSFTLGAQYSF
ncbi:TonB-dependent siderophore receptor [Uliginosibacterium aquaticum]|uniref:TonB-dependent receptor n=1 Tax=Uliginosibacterium aquaticum TaxID=2731212 RepID=A0ABX2IMU2_9RHOO|nr:TonB-dependent receptor [Uliginosibacterium aquaticum]NSL56322.1 TonB-dependent receptor [Uliginosibacterium aquaticum]